MKLASGGLFTGKNHVPETETITRGEACDPYQWTNTKLARFAKSATPFAIMLAAATAANAAAPSIDMSGVTSVMQTIQTACLLIGAIIVLISLVFSVFSFAGGNILRGVTGVAGVLFGALVIGLGPTWISSLTGQAVQ